MRSATAVPVIAFVAGVAAGVVSSVPAPPGPISIGLVSTGIAAAAVWRARRRIALPMVLCAAGLLHGAHARQAALDTSLRAVLDAHVGGASMGRTDVLGPHEPLTLRAVLIEDATDAGPYVSLRVDARRLFIDSHWLPVSGRMVISVNGAVERTRVREWRAGRTIEAPVTFRRPARYVNEGVADFERDAALNGVSLLGSIKSALLVEVIHHGTAREELAADVRASVREAIGRWILPHGAIPAAIVTAVLIGDRSGLPDDVRARLQAAGTYHVIAISGGNIAILAALILVASAVLGIHTRYTAAAAIALLVTYAAIVTAGPSVWRATLMAIVFFAARLFDHRTSPWHAMTLTAGMLAVVQPLDVRDVGFLLTFGATGGLLAGGQLMASRMPRHPVIAWVAASVLASVSAEIVLLPIAAAVFSRVTAAGVLLNLIAVPAMGVVQIAGMVAVALDPVAAVARPAGWTAAHAAVLLVESARLVDAAPGLVHRIPPPPVWLIAAYYLALLLAWRARTGKAPIPRVLVCLALMASGVLIVSGRDPFGPRRSDRVLRLTMIDVGQGESVLLQAPGGAAMLIDSGGSPFGGGAFDIGGRVLAPALWARGVRQLQTLLITHGDPDHLGGALSVVADFNPGAVWWGTPVPPHQPSREFLDAAARSGTVTAFRRTGDELPFGPARIRVLHPPPPDWERQKVRNDDSLVLEVTYGDVALLLTGDISADVERQIAPQLSPARYRILKVAHHGSRTSTSPILLDTWRPQIALISAGRGNTFGHPSPEVLDRLASAGARIYRTDRDGEITVETDGSRAWVRTVLGEEQ